METITKTLNFFSTVKNKDTLLRFFQFMNRVIINALGNSIGHEKAKAFLSKLTSAIISGRKLFAFSNAINEAANFARLSKKVVAAGHGVSLAPEKVLPAVRSALMVQFWLSDHAVFLTKFAKVAEWDADWHGTAASRCWFGAILCNIVLDTMAYRKQEKAILAEERDESKMDEETSPENELLAARKSLGFKYFRSLCDLVVATNNSKFMSFNPILVNLCGAVSAASFLYDAWK